jgi:2'-5' RNA ligase
MRLFVAVEIGAPVRRAALATIDELRERTARLAPRARMTWLTDERLHITVRFIGHVDDARGEAIRIALEAPLDAPSFDLTVEGIGAFPPRGAPRVFWAGLTAGREGLLRLERSVSARLAELVPAEDRPYAPHLTLARVKEPAGLARASLFDGLTDRLLGRVRVEAITLFESRLSSKGPTYLPLLQTMLRS